MWFIRKRPVELVRAIPVDPNEIIVDELRRDYPYGAEAFGVKSLLRVTVYVVLEMKRRGMI